MKLGRNGVLTMALASLGTLSAADDLTFQLESPAGKVAIPAPAISGSPVNYMFDDGTAENNIGLNNTATGTATQFFWFNRFDIDPTDLPLRVDQIQVFWSGVGANPTVPGNAISVHIHQDVDANPANGATHVFTQATTVAVVGTAFDAYNLTSVPSIPAGVNLLIGVVDRYVTSGVSPSTFPAAIDQTPPNNGRSWVAADAAGLPPDPPVIPSSGLFGTIDSFGLAGDWLIRATATVVPVELMGVTIE